MHEHGHTHEHSHTHDDDHTHSHEHSHTHEHTHTHSHEHTHDESPQTDAPQKEIALLKYMLEHNKQHAGELSQMGSSLSDAGIKEAAQLISEAVRDFDCANEKLGKAVSLITKD